MAVNVKITNLPPAVTPTGTEVLALVQSGVTVKNAVNTLLAAPGGAGWVGNTPAGTVAATTVQAAINELDTEKASLAALAASSGSSLVGFLQAGSGAVVRTAQSKMRDIVSVKDFGAVGDGVADDTVAIQAALNYAIPLNGCVIFFPKGTYLCSGVFDLSGSPVVGITLQGEGSDNTGLGGSKLVYSGTAATFIDMSTLNTRFCNIDMLDITSSNASFTGTLLSISFFNGSIANCRISTVSTATAAININDSIDFKMTRCYVRGGTDCIVGANNNAIVFDQCDFGRQGTGFKVRLNGFGGATFTGCVFQESASLDRSDGIKATGGALNVIGGWWGDTITTAGSPNSSCIEFDGNGLTLQGARMIGEGFKKITVIKIVSATRGVVVTGNSFSDFSAIVDLGSALTQDVVISGNSISATDSVTIGTLNSTTQGIIGQDYVTGPNNSTGTAILGGPLRFPYTDPGVSNTNYGQMLFVRSRSSAVYRWGIYALRGNFADNAGFRITGQIGGGVERALLDISGNLDVSPGADDDTSLGAPWARWSEVYAAAPAINTSDAREKQQIRNLSSAERAVAIKLKGLVRAFKFNDSVEKKGDGARIHIGIIAQEVKAAFESEGLIAENYAILCYDEWEAEPEILDDEGVAIRTNRPASSRYGVRYEELLAFIISAL